MLSPGEPDRGFGGSTDGNILTGLRSSSRSSLAYRNGGAATHRAPRQSSLPARASRCRLSSCLLSRSTSRSSSSVIHRLGSVRRLAAAGLGAIRRYAASTTVDVPGQAGIITLIQFRDPRVATAPAHGGGRPVALGATSRRGRPSFSRTGRKALGLEDEHRALGDLAVVGRHHVVGHRRSVRTPHEVP